MFKEGRISHKKSRLDDLKLASTAYQACGAAIVMMDRQYKVLNINHAFTEITGFSLAEIEGKSFDSIYDASFHLAIYEEIILSVKEKEFWRGELFICRKTNNRFPAMVLINAIKGGDGSISNVVALFLDISEHRQLEDELRYHAEIDPLTRLPNRKSFSQYLDAALASAKRFNYAVGVLYLDLDGFKQVNDCLGHGQGDSVLIEVAQRLMRCIREVDTVARLGGDEFVIVLNGTSKELISLTAQRIIDSLTMTVTGKSIELPISASVGIAVYPADSITPHELIKYADEAMYSAKHNGKSQFCWHKNSTP